MSARTKVIIVMALMAVSAAAGRFTVPTKVVIETKTVEIIKEVKVKDKDSIKNRHKNTTIVVDTHPDGSSTKTTTISDNTSSEKHETATSTKESDITDTAHKQVESDSSRVSISVLAGVNPFSPQSGITYGGHISSKVLGPITIGLFGLTSGIIGPTVGITF